MITKGKRVSSALAVVAVAFVAAVAIITTQLHSIRQHNSELLSSNPQLSILSLAKTLERDSVPTQLALTTASALSLLQNLCSQPPHAVGGSIDTYAPVKRNRENWRDTLGAFVNGKEAQRLVMADPTRVHLLIYVAPSWCIWSRKEVFELHEHFHELGAAGARIHLLDADDPDNARIMAWEGVSSYPTVVVVKGNHIVSKVAGYQVFGNVRDLAHVATDGIPPA